MQRKHGQINDEVWNASNRDQGRQLDVLLRNGGRGESTIGRILGSSIRETMAVKA
jgi:hypothetical protein